MVCVVDPDSGSRRELRALLRPLGVAVRTYGSAAEFLSAAGLGEIDCLVMETDLGDAEGSEVIRRLRERGAAPPVILIAGHGNVSTAVAALKAGAADFLEKPLIGELLVAQVARLAARHLAGGAAPQ